MSAGLIRHFIGLVLMGPHCLARHVRRKLEFYVSSLSRFGLTSAKLKLRRLIKRTDTFQPEHAGLYECRHSNTTTNDGTGNHDQPLGSASVRVVLTHGSASTGDGRDSVAPLSVSVEGGPVQVLEVNEQLKLRCTGDGMTC